MTENPYKDNLSRFAVTFARAVIAWNNAEDIARRILKSFGTSSFALTVAIDHLSGRSLKEAMLTVCDAMTDPDLAPTATTIASHVAHFVEGMDILRGYRNFYVHSLKAMGEAPDDRNAFRGWLASTEAKGRYAFINQEVPTEDLETFMRQVMELQTYGEEILEVMPRQKNSLAAIALSTERKPLSSLQKPTWPTPVTKRRNYLKER